MPPAQMSILADQDNFGDYQCVDERRAVTEIRDLKLVQYKHLVRRDGAEKERQVQKDHQKFLKFVGNLLLHFRSLGILVTHLGLLTCLPTRATAENSTRRIRQC